MDVGFAIALGRFPNELHARSKGRLVMRRRHSFRDREKQVFADRRIREPEISAPDVSAVAAPDPRLLMPQA